MSAVSPQSPRFIGASDWGRVIEVRDEDDPSWPWLWEFDGSECRCVPRLGRYAAKRPKPKGGRKC